MDIPDVEMKRLDGLLAWRERVAILAMEPLNFARATIVNLLYLKGRMSGDGIG
jgi:hypothetical protein